VSRSAMIDVTELVGVVFSGLSALVIEDVKDAGEIIVVQAKTRAGAVACPGCGAETGRVHGYHERMAADVPADGRRVLVRVRVRRMRCPVTGCARQTFREQVPGVLDRYQRRTSRLAGQVSAVARELAGRAGARLLQALGIPASWHTALRALLRIRIQKVADAGRPSSFRCSRLPLTADGAAPSPRDNGQVNGQNMMLAGGTVRAGSWPRRPWHSSVPRSRARPCPAEPSLWTSAWPSRGGSRR
jgi:hypothetical protein